LKDSLSSPINVKLSKIDAIARELPRVGKRSELKILADEILELTKMVRSHAYMLETEKVKERYTPDMGQMFGGVRSGKKE
jgi:hypothetical protein